MEKIKSALERARVSRISKTPHNTVNKRKKESHDRRNEIPESIKYTKTNVVELNAELLKDTGIITINETSAETNAYKVLRTHVLQRMRKNNWTTLGITSPTAGNGKTLTSINLAFSLSREVNQTVLLVDLDLKNPSIHKKLLLTNHLGIGYYIAGNDDISKILLNPGMDRLVILPGKDPIKNSSELLSSPRMVALFRELKEFYPGRIIIFDLPPILSCDDVLMFSPFVDSLMMVIEDSKTKKSDVTRAIQLVDKNKFIGTILNKSKHEVNPTYY